LLAGGVWLGPQHIITAILIGAAAGLVHGVGVAALHAYRTKTPMTLKRLVIPAGPGFIVGLIAAFVLAFGQGYIQSILVILGR
jgi:leader peptidase (prepilin peptidase)/N-methyltransferase